jgi:hypothetical protein
MSPLIAPVLAQLVTLQLGDRTEARYTGYLGDSPPPAQMSGSTAPSIGVGVSHRRTSLRLAYVPAITLAPLNQSPRQLYVFHSAVATASHRLRRTTFQLGSSFSIGSLALRLAAVQGPQLPVDTMNGAPPTGAPPTGAPPTGTPPTGMPTTGMPTTGTPGGVVTQQPGVDQKVRFYTSTTTLGVAHELSKEARLGATAGMTAAGGRDDESRKFYQPLRGYFVGVNGAYIYPLSKRDSLLSNLSFTKTWSSGGNEAASLAANETWGHRFSLNTTSALGAGLNITRFTQADGLAGFSIFPTFQAGGTHRVRVGRGQLSFSASVYSSPALDPLRALVDPRLGATASIGYTRQKLFVLASGSTAVSLLPAGQSGAVNAYQGEARAGYQLAKLVSIDTGARLAYQSYQGQTVISSIWAAFVGLTVGHSVTLMGGR